MDNQTYDIVVSGGRVMDPESGLDAVRNIGISGGAVEEIAEGPLHGRDSVAASGLVVAPGFVDLHCHGLRPEQDAIQVRDGVTTGLELEVGAADIESWYAEHEGASLINFGASVGHIPIRMAHHGDSGDFLPVGRRRLPRVHRRGRGRDQAPRGGGSQGRRSRRGPRNAVHPERL